MKKRRSNYGSNKIYNRRLAEGGISRGRGQGIFKKALGIFAHHLEHHQGETIGGIDRQAAARRQSRNGVIGAKDIGTAIDQQ